jgi:hypothetical protein
MNDQNQTHAPALQAAGNTSPSTPPVPQLVIHLSCSVGLSEQAWSEVLKELGKATPANLNFNSNSPGMMFAVLSLQAAPPSEITSPQIPAPAPKVSKRALRAAKKR